MSGSAGAPVRPWRPALVLGVLAGICAGVLTVVDDMTAPAIEANEALARRTRLAQALGATRFDNRLEDDRVRIGSEGGRGLPARAYRARLNGVGVAMVLETVAEEGYGGPIELLVGIDPHGVVLGVSVLSHRETPGLGDRIEPGRSPWTGNLIGRRLGDPPGRRWRLAREGGEFDALTGATITSRAVVDAVGRSLEFHDAHRPRLYGAPPGATLEPTGER